MVMIMRGQFPFIEFYNCLQHFQQKVFNPFLKDPSPSEEEADEDDALSSPILFWLRENCPSFDIQLINIFLLMNADDMVSIAESTQKSLIH